MKINSPGSQPALQEIGVQVRLSSSQNSAQSTAQTSVPTHSNPQESLQLAGLQLLDFEKAYLVVQDQAEQPFEIESQMLNQSHLLESLQRLGQRLDLHAALELHSKTADLVSAMRQAHGLAPETEVKIRIQGAFGEIELDLQRLNPEHLRASFATELAQQEPSELKQTHQALASLSQRVRSGFESEQGNSPALAQHWVAAAMNPELSLVELLSQSLGYNPLNEEASVRALMQLIEGRDPELAFSGEALFSEKTQALIDAANRLGSELDLAPVPNGPDVLELLRAFMAILRQLDQDMSALQGAQNQHRKLERKSLAHYAELQRQQAQYQQDQLDQLSQSGSQRLKLLLEQSLERIEARLWLVVQNPQHRALEATLQMLKQRQPVQV